MEVKVQKLTQDELTKMGVFGWPVWTKDVSQFDWEYDCIEECFFLEGEVILKTKDGESLKFGKNDFVTFPKGLACTWDIIKPVKKHYNFK